MPPPKKTEEPAPPQEEEVKEPAASETEVVKKCFRAGGQLYYGDCIRASGKDNKGRFIRHGYGRQVDLAVSPAGPRFSNSMAYETVVTGIYEGNWDQDTISGQGTYKWSDGSSYEGQFADNQLHGHGRFVWPDGSAYEGAWLSGSMTGQGRLDSRFDGKFHQGKFHRNCFQTCTGKWVDILEKAKWEDNERVLNGSDSNTLQIRRCVYGERFNPNARQQMQEEQTDALVKLLDQVGAEGLVPFVLAEVSLGGSALTSLQHARLADPAQHCACVRLAAVARRRRRDCDRYFYDAIKNSMLSGTLFVVAFEDDDAGCTCQQEDQQDWFARVPSEEVPATPLPEEWKLPPFFAPTTFPADVFQPILFNGRGLSHLFLEKGQPALGRPNLPGEASADPPELVQDRTQGQEGEAQNEGEEEQPAIDVSRSASSRQLLEKVSAGVVGGTVGQTNHFFEVGNVSVQDAGLAVSHSLRPAICAQGRVPDGLADEEVQNWVTARFGQHVPLHRVVVVLLSVSAEVGETSG